MSGTWSIPLDRLAARMQQDLATTARRATFELFRDVIWSSPVDTGRFRANWNVSYGAPNYSTTADTAQARGMTEATKALGMRVGGITYLTNGLPYASRLEYGWSKQAPGGMVRLAAQRFNDFVAKATR